MLFALQDLQDVVIVGLAGEFGWGEVGRGMAMQIFWVSPSSS